MFYSSKLRVLVENRYQNKKFYNETGYFSESIYGLCLTFAFKICKRPIELQMNIMDYIQPFVLESCWVLDHDMELAELLINTEMNYASSTVITNYNNDKQQQ